jgi:hypothetical protein
LELRVEYARPLLVYLRVQDIGWSRVTDGAVARAVAAGHPVIGSGHLKLWHFKRGIAAIPPWFVQETCAVLGKHVAEVMGEEWVRRFGEDGRGGQERAPVRPSRMQRRWSGDCPSRAAVLLAADTADVVAASGGEAA